MDENLKTPWQMLVNISRAYLNNDAGIDLQQYLLKEGKKRGSVMKSDTYGKICPVCEAGFDSISNCRRHLREPSCKKLKLGILKQELRDTVMKYEAQISTLSNTAPDQINPVVPEDEVQAETKYSSPDMFASDSDDNNDDNANSKTDQKEDTDNQDLIPKLYVHYDSDWSIGKPLSESTHNLLFVNKDLSQFGTELENYITANTSQCENLYKFPPSSEHVEIANNVLRNKLNQKKKKFKPKLAEDVLELRFKLYLDRHEKSFGDKTKYMYMSYIFSGTHSLKNFMMDNSVNKISDFSWSARRNAEKKTDMKGIILQWINEKKSIVTGSTRANLISACKIFITFLQANAFQTNHGIPNVGTTESIKYQTWDSELKAVMEALRPAGLMAYKQRKSEAKTNRTVSLTLDQKEREYLKAALQNLSTNQFYENICLEASKIKGNKDHLNPQLFDTTVEIIAIQFIAGSGHRPEILKFITTEDAMNITQNNEDPDLYTLNIQQFQNIKSGKTKTDLRVSLDKSCYSLLISYMKMREIIKLNSNILLLDSNGKEMTSKRLKDSKTWTNLGLDKNATFRMMRRQFSTFYAQVR